MFACDVMCSRVQAGVLRYTHHTWCVILVVFDTVDELVHAAGIRMVAVRAELPTQSTHILVSKYFT